MAFNIKSAEVERLAAEAAALAGESRTEAIRTTLEERIRRPKLRGGARAGLARIDSILARFRSEFPDGDFGRGMTKSEREEILGYCPAGV